jgi:hypothetical protein
MYIYIYMYIYVYIIIINQQHFHWFNSHCLNWNSIHRCIFTNKYTYLHIYIFTFIYISIDIYVRVHKYINTYMYIHVYIYIYKYTNIVICNIWNHLFISHLSNNRMVNNCGMSPLLLQTGGGAGDLSLLWKWWNMGVNVFRAYLCIHMNISNICINLLYTYTNTFLYNKHI